MLTYSYFLVLEKTMIWSSDGLKQHLTSLTYLGKWLREILGNLFFKHSLNLATYSFGLGFGGDIIQMLHYYSFGDPLNLLSVFVPASMTVILYSFLIVLRLYLAGLAFSGMCFYFQNDRSKLIVLAGAVVYVFGGFALFSASKHPYFINPMIYFPMIIIGVEEVLKKHSPLLFVTGVFVSAVCNLYFFYMIVIFTVLYVILRIIIIAKELRVCGVLLFLLRLFVYSSLAVVMAAIVVLPVVLQILTDPRADAGVKTELLYDSLYYKNYFGSFLSLGYINDSWLYIGVTGLSLPSLFILFKRKGRIVLKIAFIALTVLSLLPSFGKLMNGMIYPYNRWLWVYSLLVSYIVVDTADDLARLTKREFAYCGILLSVCFALCLKGNTTSVSGSLAQLLVALFVLFAFLIIQGGGLTFAKKLVLLAAAVACVGLSSFFGMSPDRSDYFRYYIDTYNQSKKFLCNESALINKKYKGGFGRYACALPMYNASLLNNNSSTQFFFSLSNPYIFDLFNELDLNIPIGQKYDDVDQRTALNGLANVKYFVSSDIQRDENGVLKNQSKRLTPYGFDKKGELWAFDNDCRLLSDEAAENLEDKDGISIYSVHRNENFLPFGYTYSNYISKKEYKKLSPLQRQEAMLQSAVLENDTNKLKKGSPSFTGKRVESDIVTYFGQTSVKDNKIIALKDNAKVELSFDGMEKCETYFSIKGLNFKGYRALDLYGDNRECDPDNLFSQEEWNALTSLQRYHIKLNAEKYTDKGDLRFMIKASGKCPIVQKEMVFYTPSYKYYEGKHNYLVNLNYSKKAKNKIVITLPYRGVYSYKDIGVYCQPMINYKQQVEKLKENTLSDVCFHRLENSGATNEITGNISLKENKLLLMSVPFSKGWTAYVDGKQTKLLRVNTAFSGLILSKGKHTIRLNYDTAGLKLGVLISALGFAVFIGLAFFYTIRMKREAKRG